MTEERFVTSTLNHKDERLDTSLRPKTFADFPGQEKKKEQLRIFVEAAKQRDEALDHLLLSGPPGLGKTTLANIIALTREKNIKTSSGPIIEKPGDLASLFYSLEEGDILFIDEIHRLSTTVEEYMYSAMEDFYIDVVLDQGTASRSIRLDIPKFTLIGATTRQGLISAPLRSRFGLHIRLDYYPSDVLSTIIKRSAGILTIPIDEEGSLEIAHRSRGTPRIANNLLRRVRDYAQVEANNFIDKIIANQALEMLEIDHDGLDQMDNRLLETILFKFEGGPVGVKNLAIALGEDTGTIEEVYEPFLIQEGYIQRTPQGRIATKKASERMGYTQKTAAHQMDLFDQEP